MKKLILLLSLTFLSVPAVQPAKAQYSVCTQYQESYQPGGYDRNGNYISSRVVVQKYTMPCGATISYGDSYQQPQSTCNPEAGALLGAGIAGAIVGGDTYKYSENYYNNRSRNSDSGGQSGTYSSNNYWKSLGAGLGALVFGC